MPANIFSKENMDMVVGITAGVLTAASMLPQVIKTLKTKKAEHVSVLMLLVLISGVSLWIVYGCIKNDLPIVCTNSFSLLVNIFMLILRWRYGNNSKARRRNMA